MAHYITAEEAAELIGPYVGLCSTDSDQRKKLFHILDLVQAKAWKKGKFRGMVKDFNVNVRRKTVNGKEKAYLITPHGYEIMLGVNLDGNPSPIHDTYFQFNPNGNGSMTNCCGCNWSEGIVDLGESPVLEQPCENTCCCGSKDCETNKIGVVSQLCSSRCRDNKESVHISGLSEYGNPVYTYEPENPYLETASRCRCLTQEQYERSKEDQKRVIEGDKFPIKNKLVIHKNINWTRIDSIRKGYSDAPVEVYGVCGDNLKLLARLEPYQRASRYRIYELPDCCCQKYCVHGLFKIGKPDKIQHGSQHLIIDDEEALIGLAKSMDMTYSKEKINEGEAFLEKGMRNLDDEHAANRSNARVPVLVFGMEENSEYDYD